MKTKNYFQKTIKTILSIFTVSIIFCGINFAQNINTAPLIKGIDQIQSRNSSSNNENIETMKNSFCESILGYAFSSGSIIYRSNQSLFVYTICKNTKTIDFGGNGRFSEDEKISFIKFFEKTNDDGEKLFINELDYNLPSFYNKTEKHIQELFDNIIGSYTSIYHANIFGYKNNEKKSTNEILNNYSKKLFDIEICATDKDYKYPKTCKNLKEYFYGARNSVNSNYKNYINNQNIYKSLLNEKDEENNCNRIDQNIVGCGLYGEEIGNFINLVYNELMFYSLFVEYYSYLLHNKSFFQNPGISKFDTQISNNQNRINKMYDNLETSKEAIQITIKTLKEYQSTFPIHIGFLMYSEDIHRFTSSLNKTLTPLYTLYDTMRNVQKKE